MHPGEGRRVRAAPRPDIAYRLHDLALSALAVLPGGLDCLAKTGPLAWNGLLAWWLGLAVFGGWIAVVSVAPVRYAIPHQQAVQARALETT